MSEAAVDEALAHVHFSKACFNGAWNLIEKADRDPVDDEQMILSNQASLWHWTQRPDCTALHRSVGYWRASRIRALVGHGVESMRYARLCLDRSAALSPFYRAMAHEAFARAAIVCGDRVASREHADRARALADEIDDPEEREIVDADLATLG